MVQTGIAQPDPQTRLKSLKQRFEQGIRSPHADDHVEAVTVLARSGRPEAVEILRVALQKTLLTEEKAHERYVKAGRKIQESTTPLDHLDKVVAKPPKVVALQKEREQPARAVGALPLRLRPPPLHERSLAPPRPSPSKRRPDFPLVRGAIGL